MFYNCCDLHRYFLMILNRKLISSRRCLVAIFERSFCLSNVVLNTWDSLIDHDSTDETMYTTCHNTVPARWWSPSFSTFSHSSRELIDRPHFKIVNNFTAPNGQSIILSTIPISVHNIPGLIFTLGYQSDIAIRKIVNDCEGPFEWMLIAAQSYKIDCEF